MRVSKYSKQYDVKSHEVDCHGFLRVLSLFNILQDIAIEHAESFGVGLELCREHNLAWVGSNYLLQINRFPKLYEKFYIETWPSEARLCSAIRDFAVYDESGEIIIKASSQWVLIDIEKRRPVVVKKYFTDYETVDEHVIEPDFTKMNALTAPLTQFTYRVRYDDIDVNKHVNNAVYVLWASESVEENYRFSHSPCEIEVAFKKETLYGAEVKVETQISQDESHHQITDNSTGAELAQCRIKWQDIN